MKTEIDSHPPETHTDGNRCNRCSRRRASSSQPTAWLEHATRLLHAINTQNSSTDDVAGWLHETFGDYRDEEIQRLRNLLTKGSLRPNPTISALAYCAAEEIETLRSENRALRAACERLDDCRWCGNKRILDDRSNCPYCEQAHEAMRGNNNAALIAEISALIDADDYAAARIALAKLGTQDPERVRLETMLWFLETPVTNDNEKIENLRSALERIAKLHPFSIPSQASETLRIAQCIARDALEGK